MTEIDRPPFAAQWPLPGAPATLTWSNWDWPPQNRWAFQHVGAFLRTARIARGHGPAWHFGSAPRDLTAVTFTDIDGATRTVGDMLTATYTDGFLVAHDGKLVAEIYMNGMERATLHLSQSMVKSFTSALVGILVGAGELAVDRLVSDYVPELANCGYRGATVSQVLDMRSGVKFDEDYLAPNSEVAMLDRASGWKPRRDAADTVSIKGLILALQQERPHGGAFLYRSIETEVLGWIISKITGQDFATFLSNALWQPMGAEADATITIDHEGTGLADGGFNASLRDYARFGQLFLDSGARGTKQVVPEAWVLACRTGDVDAFRPNYAERYAVFPNAAYSKQWWVFDTVTGLHQARGIYGQLIHVEPARRLVVVKLSSWLDPINDALSATTFRAIDAIGRELVG
ncbi:serine hydrolase domain-containing protein [Dongia deserti]|uniref:serine hydrolase domain-containing protein n=1 Tax=Dongia deserti TaxID=2268030 RepID=UPI000E64F378|nr:serine hydrolase [Dongia deserti]